LEGRVLRWGWFRGFSGSSGFREIGTVDDEFVLKRVWGCGEETESREWVEESGRGCC